MKTPFLLSQKILTASATVILLGCVAGDLIALFMDFGSKTDWVFIVNLLLSLIVPAFFLLLIFKPEKTRVVSDNENGDKQPVLSATRTYICIIYLDVALILALVLFGSAFISNVELSIIGVAAIVFIIGAVKYIFDSRKINTKAQMSIESDSVKPNKSADSDM